MRLKQPPNKVCPRCSKAFYLSPALERRNIKFCSQECKFATPPEERFWPKVDKNGPIHPYTPSLGECWIWKGALQGAYGYFGLEGKNILTHRFAYQTAKGAIPEGLHVLHSCDRPLCVNPIHLSVGTVQDNVDDMMTKGRKVPPRGERNAWSKLTPEKVVQIKTLFPSLSKKELGLKFDVHAMTIHAIVTGKSWNHITV